MSNKATMFIDGSCLGNPGPGGWAVVWDGTFVHDFAGSEEDTTNNRMELLAAIQALQHACSLSSDTDLEIVSDSSYVVDGANKWRYAWAKNGWKTGSGSPVANADLWHTFVDTMKNVTCSVVFCRNTKSRCIGIQLADMLAKFAATVAMAKK